MMDLLFIFNARLKVNLAFAWARWMVKSERGSICIHSKFGGSEGSLPSGGRLETLPGTGHCQFLVQVIMVYSTIKIISGELYLVPLNGVCCID